MRTKIFYGILSALIIIPIVISIWVAIVNHVFYLFEVGWVIAISVITLIIIQKYPNKKQKQRNDEKNDSKESPHLESKDNKNLLGMIQERLAKGEISVNEYQELKKEILS